MAATLKIIFAGTPEFSASALKSCIDSKHKVVAVFTQPDRPSGRGRKIQFSPVKQLAVNAELPIYQPVVFDQEQFNLLEKLNADVMLVSAYGLLLPQQVLDIPRLGCINIHASLLPKWRGAAPIQRSIIAGDTQTGISIMKMVEELDAGPVLKTFRCEIESNDTGSSLHDRLANIAATEIVETLEQLHANQLEAHPQNHDQSSYAKKLSKQEANIDWSESAELIERKIRAFISWPIAYTFLNDQRIRIWAADLCSLESAQPPGQILATDKRGIQVATGKGVINITSLQLAGGNVISAQDFANAHNLDGQHFSLQSVKAGLRVSA